MPYGRNGEYTPPGDTVISWDRNAPAIQAVPLRLRAPKIFAFGYHYIPQYPFRETEVLLPGIPGTPT